MEIRTKFNLGDDVFPIRKDQRREYAVCPECDGIGSATTTKGKQVACPGHCGWGAPFGKIVTEYKEHWIVDVCFVVKKISSETFSADLAMSRPEITYMAGASGWVVPEDQCFATHEEARAECEKRNAELRSR